MPRLRPLRTCLFVILAATAAAAEPWADLSAGWLDREAALAAAAASDPDRFPDADLVLVDSGLRVRYAPDGTYVQWHEAYVKLLTEKGRRRYRTLSSYFTIPYQTEKDCTIPLIEITGVDGRTRTVDAAATGAVQSDPRGMGANIYNPNDKILRVNLPGLEVGDLLHYVMYDRVVQPRMRGTWCDFVTFEGTEPILHKVVEVDAPADLPLRSVAVKDPIPDSLAYRSEERDGRTYHRWEAREVPRLFPEPQMPPVYMVAQRLLVSTAPDWETVSRWYWELCEPHLEADAAMRSKVAELVAGAADDAERTERIFHWVAQEVRYLGITTEDTAPGYEPHDVTATFAQRHGVCRDKAALLVAMLRLAGLEAFPTLIHAGTRKDPEVPQPYFNHAIVAVRGADGAYILMDPTDETSKELLPSYLNHKSYLVATPEGDPLRTSPIVPAAKNLARIRTRASVDADGRLTAETVIRFEGVNDNAYRGFFSRRKPEDVRRYFAGVVKAAASGARLVDLRIEPADATDRSVPLSATLRFTAPVLPVTDGRIGLLPLPVLGTRVGMVNFILGRTGLPEREYPLRTDLACGIVEELDLEIDPACGAVRRLPELGRIEEDCLAWLPAVERTDAGLRLRGDFRLEAVEFSPEQYLVLKKALRVIEQDLRKMPLFARPSDAEPLPESTVPSVAGPPPARADVRVQSDELAIELLDARSWNETRRVEKEILTYAGVKRNAEIKLRFNAGWDAVEILRAAVTAPDGSERAIDPTEINTLDAGWVGAAKRYPADRTTVAALPAVAVGSTVSYAYRVERRRRLLCWRRVVFGRHDPIDRQRVVLSLPTELDARLRWRVSDEEVIAHDRERAPDGSRVVHTWTATDLPALPREDGCPPAWAHRPTLFLALGDTAAYAVGVHARLTARAAEDEGVAEAVAEATAGLEESTARIRAIRDFVAVNIRATGPGLSGMPLEAVSAAGTVLADGYGNNPDRCVLLAAMLRHAGFEPRFVLASRLPRHPELLAAATALPSTDYDHVLVAVDDPARPGETTYHLGDTDQYDPLSACPYLGRPALLLPSGEALPRLGEPPERTELTCTVTLTADGTATIAREEHHYGLTHGGLNKFYAELTPEKRRRHHLELLDGISRAAEAVGALTTEFAEHPGTRAYAARVPAFAVRDGDLLYCELPESWERLLRLGADTRGQPWYLPDRRPAVKRVVVELPPGWEVVLAPPALDSADPLAGSLGIHSRVTSEADGGRLIVTYAADLDPTLLPPERYGELLALQARLRHPAARMVLLRKGPPVPAD